MADKLRKEHKNTTIIEQEFVISDSKIQNSQLGTFESKLVSEDKIKK